MKWLLIVVAVFLALGMLVFLIGAALPQGHRAAVRVRFEQPPSRVYAALADVNAATSWREDLKSVEVLSADGEPLRWRETGKFGSMTMLREEDVPDRRIVSRIVDTGEGFGGRWTYELEPANGGTVLTVTEDGEVYNPIFRFVSRFIFGYHGTMENYLRTLGRHLGKEVSPKRVV